MANLPPSPFTDSGENSALPPDDAAASLSSHLIPDAAADIQGSAPPISTGPTTAAVAASQPVVTAAPSDTPKTSVTERRIEEALASCPDAGATDLIAEIFVGARKLEQPGPFDPAAITPLDEVMYEALRLLDDPRARDLPYLPDPRAFMDEIEPLPLFLRQASGF